MLNNKSGLVKNHKIMERDVLSQTGKTLTVVALIVCLLIGVALGWVAKPTPSGISQEEYDALQSERDTAQADLLAAQADLGSAQTDLADAQSDLADAQNEIVAVQADLDGKSAELDATLEEMGALVRTLIGVGPEAPVESTMTGVVQLGGLFGLSGRLATFGENEYTAALLAAEQVNAFLESIGADWMLEIVAEDTEAKDTICLEKVESLAARGIKLMIGPLSSAELRAIMGYCDANKVLAISQSSTAPDLAIPGDYIFRFCPTDKLGQGPAIGRIMYDDGKRYVIPVAVNDAWGVGLMEAAIERFEELGGTILEGILYTPEAPEFSAEASDLNTKVTNAIATYGADQVCVLHIAFEEVAAWFTATSEYEVLSSIKWYGSDGTAGSSVMLEDPVVSAFSVMVDYPSPIFAPTESAKWEMVRQNGVDVLGRDPESYSYGVYDVVWAYALSILKADSADPESIKEVLPEVAQSFFGASGWIELDEAGDRKAGDYVIWQIVETAPGEYEWQIVGKFILATDSVEWHI